MAKPARIAVAGLAASAAFVVALATSEGFIDVARVPVQGDPPTGGFGSTVHADGSPVRIGDRFDPVRALVTLKAHVDREEAGFQRSLAGAHLHQAEYDVYLDFVYQYGIGNWNRSSMRRLVLAGEHRAACDALLMWRKQDGRDCSAPENWGPRGCKGVWTRQIKRHARCVAAQ